MQNRNNAVWEEICFILSENINENINEKDFESQVIRAIEILGWKEFKKEISRQETIKIGRSNKLIPDIIISGNTHKPIVVEIKRPSEDISLDKPVDQLKSYMRQKKADFGWLIGKEIRVYYDGYLNPHADDLFFLEKIVYDKSIPEGARFVEIFSKDNFTKKIYESYLDRKVSKYNEEKEVNKLKKILLANETKLKIQKFLETEFLDYGASVFDKAVNELDINITEIQPPLEKTITNLHRQPQKTIKRKEKNNTSENNELSGRTFTLAQLVLKKLGKEARPQELNIDGCIYTVKNWVELTTTIVEWLNDKGFITDDKLPIYNYTNRKDKYFINNEKQHKNPEKKGEWKPVGNFFVDIKYDADNHKKNIIKALEILHVKPDIEITFR